MARTYPCIIQVIPASGFEAVYKDGSRYPVVCWALIENDLLGLGDGGTANPDTITEIQGMVMVQGSAFLDFCAGHAIEHDGREFSHYDQQDD